MRFFLNAKINKIIALSIALIRAFYAVFLTIKQYDIWSENTATQIFLNSPLGQAVPIPEIIKNSVIFQNKFGYFIFYSYGRFWLDFIIIIICSAIFYSFLKLLRKYQERFFEQGEVELGLVASFTVGWPNFVLFLPLVFILVVIISIFRRLFLKEFYTTLGLPLIFATIVMIIFGEKLINIFNFGVLKI